MRLISRLRKDCFCAFCKSPRRVYAKKHVDLTNVIGVSFLSFALADFIWGSASDPRGLLLCCILILCGETFVYLRWRSSVVCRMCGFDPVIYKRSPERAAQLVKTFFQEAANKPEFWLSKSPLLQIHRRLREQEMVRQKMQSRAPAKAVKKNGNIRPQNGEVALSSRA